MEQTTENLLRVEAIFHEALAAAPAERSAVVEARCQGDLELAAEVSSLLRASEAEEQVAGSRRQDAGSPRDPRVTPRRIGAYLLDSLVGRGGMGAVYLAHRADGQFEQKVAIKLIDLPLATDLFRERFRQERQILANLQHPLIARLLDGGVTEHGDLYLAMEFVDGVPIHRHCEEKKLTLRQRLMLFRTVCEAVQFAHQNLVVHRDLKPDNIFVTEDGTPRLLDFGTAKLLSSTPETPGSEMTRQGYQSFTPQYASPEQVLGTAITTASDTYSLGVLLYLLVTRTLPYTLESFSPAEMMRVICEEPPRRPAAQDGEEPLDSDLEAILLKSLRKSPESRYVTAVEFAADIQAWLERRPISARRGTFRYRVTKFIHRHRLALAAAALLALVLAGGVAAVLWQSRVANMERRRAEERSADLRQLSTSLLSELDDAIRQLPGSTGAQHLLVARVLDHLDRMARDAKGDHATQLDLIDAYTRLSDVQANPYEQNLGDRVGGLASIDKAIALAQSMQKSAPNDREVLQALAKAQGARGDILSETTDISGAVASLRAEVESYDRLIALPGVTPQLYLDDCSATSVLGDVLGQDTGLADVQAALTAYRRCLDLDRRALALDPAYLPAQRGLANMQMKVGNADLDVDPNLALRDFQLSLQEVDALPAAQQIVVSTRRLRGIIVRKIGTADAELGHYAEAARRIDDAIAIHQQLADADSKDMRSQGDLYRAFSDEADAYELAVNPALSESPVDRRQNLEHALAAQRQALAHVEIMLRKVPTDVDRQAERANLEAHVASTRQLLHQQANLDSAEQKSLDALRSDAARTDASPHVLTLALTAWLQAEPASQRVPQFTLALAERLAALTHRKAPEALLALSEAQRAAGESAHSRATAREGLALLPIPAKNDPVPRVRKLLALEAADASDSRRIPEGVRVF
jgi:hypothetical protein